MTNHGLTEEDSRDRDRWRNLVLGEGKPLKSGQTLRWWWWWTSLNKWFSMKYVWKCALKTTVSVEEIKRENQNLVKNYDIWSPEISSCRGSKCYLTLSAWQDSKRDF
jgi:hypothetical protein